MAVSSRSERSELSKKYTDRETSPERTKVWKHKTTDRKVAVVYYLSRNGQLEHPHLIEVPLSSPEGLYLKDVINRLNVLRGVSMPTMYSWSSKRSYKNGFVWHDLSDNDFIYPAHGQEYVLKGSELLLPFTESSSSDPIYHSHELTSSTKSPEEPKSGDFSVTRRRNQSWSAIEYKVYKTESTGDSVGNSAAADASTQTDEKRRCRRNAVKEEVEEPKAGEERSVELSRDEISPPPSDSSPETLETLMKADKRLMLVCEEGVDNNRTAGTSSGKVKGSSVLMQLISCGSFSFKDCGATAVKDHGLSLITQYKCRLPRGASVNNSSSSRGEKTVAVDGLMLDNTDGFGKVRLEDKEYFSGSLIETKKDEFFSLKRSSSYNADRSSRLELGDNEGGKGKCVPKKEKAASKQQHTKKERNRSGDMVICEEGGSCSSSSSGQYGSKRLDALNQQQPLKAK